jgi:hypothetical protein
MAAPAHSIGVPADSIGVPADPTRSPEDAQEGLLIDPVAMPPDGVPATPSQKTSPDLLPVAPGSSQGVPFLSDLPLVGQLFRITRPGHALPALKRAPALAASRSIPVLSDIPIIGILFRITTPIPVTPSPAK